MSRSLSADSGGLPRVPWRVVLHLLGGVAFISALGAAPARARIDWAKESGVIQLDSATAVAGGASPRHWRGASPLAVPDRFGPGSVLRVGNIRMKVVNNGTLGNPYPNTSNDPSAQWPGLSGIEYLNSITLAVGAVNPFADDPSAKRRVSSFQEWRPPTLEPVDHIYTAFEGITHGERFANDDGDIDPANIDTPQKIDEDFLDGRDNDGDGLIDEDFAALGQQEFSYVIRDDTPEAVNTLFNEKHVPIGLQANVRVWTYRSPPLQDFNVCEYDIVNVSGHELDSLVIGWLVDMDAGPVQQPPYWADDVDFPQYPSGAFRSRIGSALGEFPDLARKQGAEPGWQHAGLPTLPPRFFPPDSALCPMQTLRINAFSLCDQDGDQGRTPGVATFMLIDHTIDLTDGNGPPFVGFRSFRSAAGVAPFSQGGLPRTDQERFESMVSGEGVDPSTRFINAPQAAHPGDYVEWCSVGPWRHVQPGQTITATIAFAVTPGTAALAGNYMTDYRRYQDGTLSGGNLIAKFPALASALTAQVAFEGINEYRKGYLETKPVSQGGRDFHGRETPVRLPPGSEPQVIIDRCFPLPRGEVLVTDREYSWFDFDCDLCTGVWAYDQFPYPHATGLFHKTWNAATPPPNPATNVSTQYNFTDNPDRRVVASEDKAVRLAWDNVSEWTADPQTLWLDFRGFDFWKAADWTRPVGSAGPYENDWLLLGEFRVFDYFKGNSPGDTPLEHNYSRDATTGDRVCPQLFCPSYYDPVTRLRGKVLPICLDRFDLWDRQTGTVIRPDWTTPCAYDSTTGGSIPFEIDSGDLEWNAPAFVGGSYAHVFKVPGNYPYLCMRHITQKGMVVVVEGGADSAAVQILGSTSFAPAAVTIRPGGLVRWVNLSDANHALQTDRGCQTSKGVIVHRLAKTNAANLDTRIHYPVGRYQFVDHEVKNGFEYFYSVTAFDSTTNQSITTQLGGLRSAFEAEAVVPEVRVDAKGKRGVWVVPNPYRGYARLRGRPSAWDLTPNASDPTGTHVDFFGLPPGPWTIRIYTVSGDLVEEIHSTDAVNESIRHPVRVGSVVYPGYTRQQDNADDGQARWNLISRSGQDVVSGIYLFTVDSAEGSQRGKFVIIR